AKELASARGTTAGKVVSELARLGLARDAGDVSLRNGVPLLSPRPATEPRVTMKRVNELRDER
nr:CopG family transcriptional regulator [Acidobacteriota bacterium]